MPSHLTRVVFRKLVADELVNYHGCLRRANTSRRPTVRHVPASCTIDQQRRSFFNFFKKAKRDVKEADIPPGLEKLMEYTKMERLKARLPPPEEVATALRLFFIIRPVKPEDEHLKHVLPALRYVRAQEDPALLANTTLLKGLAVLAASQKHRTIPKDLSRDLAMELFNECRARQEAQGSGLTNKIFYFTIDILCSSYNTTTARDLLLELSRNEMNISDTQKEDLVGEEVDTTVVDKTIFASRWNRILGGFAEEDNEPEMIKTMEMMPQYCPTLPDQVTCLRLSNYYATKGDVETAKSWYERSQKLPDGRLSKKYVSKELEVTYESLVRTCISKQDLAFGQALIRDIISNSPTKNMWDLVFLWAVGSGKGVDEIDRMMGVLEKANLERPHTERVLVDVDTINKLVEYAISRNDPYTAERFIDLGKRRNVQPNARTLVLQMDYRLSVNDIDGALIAYKYLQAQDLSTNQDVATVNRLLCAMCGSGRHDFESIMNVAADLSDRKARFEPLTVSTLSVLHFSRGELHDVIDLLNTHVYHYSTLERASIRDTLVDYCIRPATSTAQSWDAYTIIRQIFDELDRTPRTQLMNNFFRRERPDMAVHVFLHMRTHSRDDTIPTIDTYVSCFSGIADLKDEESLEAVHNQLKLDHNIEPDTRLLNALMLAYTACENPRRALGFWNDIAASREGPSLSSIHLAFRACEISPWGDDKAREIWERLQKTGMEFHTDLWASYISGLAGNGKVEATINELEKAHSQGAFVLNSFVVGSLFNAAPGQTKKVEVEEWAKQRYPALWAELEGIGMDVRENDMRYFKINRRVEP